MKKFTKAIVLLSFLTFVLASCSKDEEEAAAPKTNFISLDGTEFSLSQGITFEYGGDATTGYNFDLIVASSGLDFSDIDNNGITGKGEAVYFELWSTSSTGLETGSYSFNSGAKPSVYTAFFVRTAYDASTDIADETYESATGTITINVDGSTYTIDFDLILTGGKKLTGNYKGSLTNLPG